MEISSDERFASSLQYIRRRLATVGNVQCTLHNTQPRQVLRIEIRGASAVRQISAIIADAIADIIVTDCKAYYIGDKIRLPIEDAVSRHAFIRALSTFDRDTDKIIAKTLLKLTPHFYLDSFYEFMLDVLKSRWNEVCILANENICYLVCQKTFLELLRFLISNIESLSDEAHIVARGEPGKEELEVLGRGLKPLKNIYINESLPQDVQVVTKLVTIAPKRIFIYKDDSALVQSIKNLFGSCVVVN